MTVHWLNSYYAIIDGKLIDNDRLHYRIVKLNGDDTGKYAFSLEKAKDIAKRLTECSRGDLPVPSCTDCQNKTEWKHHHVYVIELSPRIMRERSSRILGKNPQASADAPCFYVGSTRHKCGCRFQQHRLDYRKKKGYRCQCYGGDPTTRYFRRGETTKGTRGSYLAGRYGVRLRPDLYAGLNPISNQETARRIEKELAARMRENGAAVLQA